MARLDRLATRLVAIRVDWLLHPIWWTGLAASADMGDGPILPQRLLSLLLMVFIPSLMLTLWRCMRLRDRRHPYWRYDGAIVSMWLLTMLAVAVCAANLIS